jgi:hypothetical protein
MTTFFTASGAPTARPGGMRAGRAEQRKVPFAQLECPKMNWAGVSAIPIS